MVLYCNIYIGGVVVWMEEMCGIAKLSCGLKSRISRLIFYGFFHPGTDCDTLKQEQEEKSHFYSILFCNLKVQFLY